MAEYIEREALLSKISRMIDYCEKDHKVNTLTALFQVGDAIIDCNVADVAPVRRGKWIKDESAYYPDDYYCACHDWRCSNCGETANDRYKPPKYCPECGARMDGEAHE